MYEARVTSNGNERYHAITRHAEFEMATNGTGSSPTDVLLEREFVALHRSVSGATEGTNGGLRSQTLDVRKAALSEAAQTELLRFITQCQIRNTLKANCRLSICVRASEPA